MTTITKWAIPGYGKPGPKVGGIVTIKGRVGDRVVSRRVSIAPAFDPLAISMTPLPGWTAAATMGAPFRATFPVGFRPDALLKAA